MEPEHSEAYTTEAEIIVSPEEIVNRTLQDYFVLLTNDLQALFRSTDNGSKKKAYNEVRRLINTHKKKWDYQFKKHQNANKEPK